MNRDDAFSVVVEAIRQVAPDVDPAADPDADLQADLDLDSMDLLNIVIAVHERSGVDIPERDYGELASVSRFVDYLLRVPAAS